MSNITPLVQLRAHLHETRIVLLIHLHLSILGPHAPPISTYQSLAEHVNLSGRHERTLEKHERELEQVEGSTRRSK